MREGAKKRLAGAAVVVALAIIFVPMLFDESPPAPTATESQPTEPAMGLHTPAQPLEPAPETPASTFAAESEPPPLPPSTDPGSLTDAVAGAEDMQAPGATSDFAPPGQPGQIGLTDAVDEPPVTRITPPPSPSEDRAERPREPARPPSRPGATVERPVAVAKPAQPQPKREVKPLQSEPRPAPESKSKWVIQVASLTAQDAASEMQKKLRGAGFAAFVEKAEVRGKTFYRVRVGPNSDRAGAERTAALLRQQQKLDTLIQRQAER